jgi:hypothetical protein
MKQDDGPAPVKRQASRRKTGSRAPRLLEQSASRNARQASIRMASATRDFKLDFWEQMSLYGN